MTFTKIDPVDLDSPRRELSNGGLKSVVSLLVRWQTVYVENSTLMSVFTNYGIGILFFGFFLC